MQLTTVLPTLHRDNGRWQGGLGHIVAKHSLQCRSAVLRQFLLEAAVADRANFPVITGFMFFDNYRLSANKIGMTFDDVSYGILICRMIYNAQYICVLRVAASILVWRVKCDFFHFHFNCCRIEPPI